jgi:hypothetical protein
MTFREFVLARPAARRSHYARAAEKRPENAPSQAQRLEPYIAIVLLLIRSNSRITLSYICACKTCLNGQLCGYERDRSILIGFLLERDRAEKNR